MRAVSRGRILTPTLNVVRLVEGSPSSLARILHSSGTITVTDTSTEASDPARVLAEESPGASGGECCMMSSLAEVVPGLARPPAPRKMKSVACRKCNARKVKCPGGQPCRTCVQLDCTAECTYPKRDRQIRVSENYINSILQQNQVLQARLQSIQSIQSKENATEIQQPQPCSLPCSQPPAENEEPSQNPTLGKGPWFVPAASFSVPLRVGECGDTAFVTRFRQSISSKLPKHPPRLKYPSEEHIMALSVADVPQTNPPRARFLVQAALANVDKSHHIVRKNSAWALLDVFLETPTALDLILRCKIFALLGLGELYSSHSRPLDTDPPGLAYFSVAFRAYGYLLERPSIESIEVCLLLCLYSLCINRSHSAYSLANSAVRQCALMGLNLNVPPTHLKDNAAREHIRRVWWTSYILEHICAVNSGLMVRIEDDEVLVDLPSNDGLPEAEKSDFEDPTYTRTTIRLVRLSRKVTSLLYGRRGHAEPFIQRVQTGLKELKAWYEALPYDLKVDPPDGTVRPVHVESLHLRFNHNMIFTTRPLLLHVLRMRNKRTQEGMTSPSTHLPDAVHVPVQVCIRAARQIHTMLSESWINGSFKPFDYTRTQYLFCAATILAASSLLGGPGSLKDRDDFDLACQLVQELQKSGSVVAADFYQHLEAIKEDISDFLSRRPESDNTSIQRPEYTQDTTIEDEKAPRQLCTSPELLPTNTALNEPSLGAVLLRSEPGLDDVCYLDASQLEDLYWPPLEM